MEYPFWFGGSASSMATLFTHPLDLVKVRLQATPNAQQACTSGTMHRILLTEGFTGLYSGLSAALLRQMTYSTVRFGVYEDLKIRLRAGRPVERGSGTMLIPLSAFSGFIAGVVGNPADIVNVRMQSDKAKLLRDQTSYRHVFDGLVQIIRKEGPLSGLFRGVGANATRAALMNSSQLASYDICKSYVRRNFGMGDSTANHLVSSAVAGMVATTICSPVDVVKTRVMSSSGPQGAWNVLRASTLREGPAWIFKGWFPSFMRLGPQTVLTMMFFEQHKSIYSRFHCNLTSKTRSL
ncbi:unnamed protein product [Clonostachys rosea f. rosea IK726]|uniref:Mitochondrial dicarboxylate carrier n=2 Tax=Bionectria ochroleuca TaxID=29856 RepID=A0A0B7KG14_BIOOC|nr:unnamed protein product [Clonostachys rosea f. rosea IK726]